MKSIKEKSNEYAKEYLFSPLPQRAPNVHFEAGANYAIAKAVEWLKGFCNEHYIMSYADSSEVETKELIDIFKKKMEE